MYKSHVQPCTTAVTLLLLLVLAGCGHGRKQAATTTTEAPKPKPPTQHFVTRPDLRPPPVKVLTPARGTAPGYLFVAPKKEVAQAGPMILDDAGQVVWFRPLDTHGVTDFRVQRYRGRPVLTWWRGQSDKGIGDGRYVIYDDHYRLLRTVSAGNGLAGDIHEFLITPRNTALFTIYRTVKVDLTRFGGPKDGEIKEGVVQEVDIASGKVLFEWHSYPRVALSESYEPLPKQPSDPWDYFHLNSIDVDRDGNLILSARHTSTIYEVRRSDGRILWRLGGKRSDFRMGPGTEFAWQHDARRRPDGTLTLFDNAASHPAQARQSKVLVLRLDEANRRATLARSYAHRPRLLSTSQGNAQFLPDGHVVVGWGSNPYVTEFDRAGRVLLDVRFGVGKVDSYRAFRNAWTGWPLDRPAAALRGGTVYVSWNGATQVVRWRVRGRDGTALASSEKHGFETAIPITGNAASVTVEALGAAGQVLGRSTATAR
jgi:hypothetical protein